MKFHEYVGKNNYVIVEFYTKWCESCKMLYPEYEKLIEEYKDKRKDIIFTRIDGQDNYFIIKRYDIFSFPVIALFQPNDKHIYKIYQNKKIFDELNKWVNESCPLIIEEKTDTIKSGENNDTNKNEENNDTNNTFKINESEFENQNLTTEDEFITNQFIYINKRIDNLKNKLKKNIDKSIKPKKEEKKIKFEIELSPLFILFCFIVSIIGFYLFTSIKKIFLNKSHLK